MNKTVTMGLVGLTAMLLSACGTSVKRIDVTDEVDLSGAWNDTDSRLVSEEMIQDALSRPWVANFMRQEDHLPTVIVGTVRNLSHEHINVRTFVADMESCLLYTSPSPRDGLLSRMPSSA